MHIEELHLENFRGFKELTLKFPSKLAVIIGVNGSGKSSILDSLSILLTNSFFNIVEGLETSHLQVTEEDSNIKSSMTKYPRLLLVDINTLANQGSVKAKLDYYRTFTNLSVEFDASRFGVFSLTYRDNRNELYSFIYQRLKDDKNTSIPIFLHFRTNRFTTTNIYQEAFKTPFILFPQLAVYLDCASIKQNDFATFFQWFRNQEDIENEERLEVNPEYRDKQLEAVKMSITNLLLTVR
jgi:predicted ATP-dependent endonuclease of OLD family